MPPIYLVGSRTASWHIWPLDGSQDWRESHDVSSVAADRPGPWGKKGGADLQQASGQNVKAGGIAYVEAGTGNVDRFPLEALIAGSWSVDPAGEPR